MAADQRLGRAAEALFRDWLCIYCLLLHEDFVLSPCARKIMTFNRLFSNKLCCKTSTLLEFQIVEAHHYHRHIGCCCRHNLKFLGLIEFDLSFFLLNFLIYCSPSQIFRLSTDIRCANWGHYLSGLWDKQLSMWLEVQTFAWIHLESFFFNSVEYLGQSWTIHDQLYKVQIEYSTKFEKNINFLFNYWVMPMYFFLFVKCIFYHFCGNLRIVKLYMSL